MSRKIRKEMRTTASPAEVYRAWADPAILPAWFTDDARGEARAGGTMTWIFARFGAEIVYEVVEAVAGERLVLRWSGEGKPPGLLEVTIRRDGGETVLTLVNSGFREGAEWDDEYEGVDSGWSLALGSLRYYLERAAGRPRTEVMVMRPAQFERETLRALYATPAGRERWMGAAARLAGPERVDTGTELQLESPAIGDLLELKTFFAGPGRRMVALRASSWTGDAPAMAITVAPEGATSARPSDRPKGAASSLAITVAPEGATSARPSDRPMGAASSLAITVAPEGATSARPSDRPKGAASSLAITVAPEGATSARPSDRPKGAASSLAITVAPEGATSARPSDRPKGAASSLGSVEQELEAALARLVALGP